MKRILLLVSIILAIIGLTGCSWGKDIGQAKAVGQAYYEALKAKDFDAAMSFYSPQLFQETSQADILQALKGINAKLGDLQSYKFANWQENSYAGTGGSYTRYSLDYETTYSKGSAKETLTFVKSEDGSKMQIRGLKISSLDLLKY